MRALEVDRQRVAWVDYAKGFCIVMVVMMHSTLGVEHAAGDASWMGWIVAFAKPFRMPDFFLISGLFLARVIDRDWSDYLDRKVVHFAYFYALWVTIQFAFKAPGFAAELGWVGVVEEYLLSFVQPFGTLWFIYLLPIFFVVTKLARNVPVPVMFVAACALQIASPETGLVVVDEFCSRFVYFYTGYAFAPYVFRFAENVMANRRDAVLFLCAWALFEALMVYFGYSALPVVGLGLGFVGAMAVVAVSALLSTRNWALPLRFAGQNSIVVYLAFFLPMAVTRTVLLKFAPELNLGVTALLVTTVAAITPLIFFVLVRNTWFAFLFRRPAWAHLGARKSEETLAIAKS
ncbi:acyltransferase family protein [Methyloligella sp. 2.7D]|uniref:acyltransferase family protein n=1 Tax=unclassified Methyloligella TaxID=2625955 RepID=UPI00157DBB60|nr:acyltransferase family protein [Methyloligella sp. GL2]QKP75982.1 acyltransferase family protein [Methyloligella sp. GL2]